MPLSLKRLTSPAKEPKPSERQLVAIRRLFDGRGNDNDKDSLNRLTDECRKAGCPITEPGRSKRGIDDCPGWCELSARYTRDRKTEMAALGKDPGTAKPYRLGPAARRAYAALESGEVGASDLLEVEKLVFACRQDGCVVEDPGAATKCGVDACPGWCAKLELAWESWWSS